MSGIRKQSPRDPRSRNVELENVFNSMLVTRRTVQLRGGHGRRTGWRPPIDMYETESGLHVIAEIAGVEEEQIELAIDDSILTIRGERLPMRGDNCSKMHELGILHGPFAADIYLPISVDKDSIEATYSDGMLQVRLHRVQPTRIAINRDSGSK